MRRETEGDLSWALGLGGLHSQMKATDTTEDYHCLTPTRTNLRREHPLIMICIRDNSIINNLVIATHLQL